MENNITQGVEHLSQWWQNSIGAFGHADSCYFGKTTPEQVISYPTKRREEGKIGTRLDVRTQRGD